MNELNEHSTARAKARGESMPTIEALPIAPILTPDLEAAISKLPTVDSEPENFGLSFKEASKLQIENSARSAAGVAELLDANDQAWAVRSSTRVRQSLGSIPPLSDVMIAGGSRQYSEAEIAALCRLPSYGSKEWLQTATPQELQAYQKDLMLPKAVAVDGPTEARLEYQRQTTRNSIGMSLLTGLPGAALPGQLSRLAGMNEYRVADANEIGGALAGLELSIYGIPERGSQPIYLGPRSFPEPYVSTDPAFELARPKVAPLRRIDEMNLAEGPAKFTDGMNDKQYGKLIKSIQADGLQNKVIQYVEIENTHYIVVGNNRVMAAQRLGMMDQLQFQRVEFPVPKTNFETPADVLNASGTVKMPRYRSK